MEKKIEGLKPQHKKPEPQSTTDKSNEPKQQKSADKTDKADKSSDLKRAVMNHPEMEGLNWDDIRTGLNRILPLLETAAKMTENPVDDLAVEFIKKLTAQ